MPPASTRRMTSATTAIRCDGAIMASADAITVMTRCACAALHAAS